MKFFIAIRTLLFTFLLLAGWNVSAAIEDACGTTTWQLTAGQTINVGTVTVKNDLDNIYVTYSLMYDPDGDGVNNATLGNLHLWIGNSLLNMPTAPNGAPIPGQFCQADGGACHDATGLTTYTFTIPFADLNIVDVSKVCPLTLKVVTHAEVDLNGDGQGDHETAFGGSLPGGGPRWWFYGDYNVCCDQGPPPVASCDTAFAKGGYVWTTDRKSNPENLPSLNLTKNRWGWASNLTTPGTYTYNLWAGAGLNNTTNGVLVGTVTYVWDGTTVDVIYKITNPGYSIEEVHVYAGDSAPTTTAPGQYGYTNDFDPNVTTYTFEDLPLVDADGIPGVWLIAHGVVCK